VGKLLQDMTAALQDCREALLEGTITQQRPDGGPTRTARAERTRLLAVIDRVLNRVNTNGA